ncbi:unnamed protein product [Rhodiola kirilowii]
MGRLSIRRRFSSSSTTASVKLPVGGLYSTPNVQSLWSV